jgi:hypothetical protein
VKRGVFILLLLTAAAAGIACGEWTCRLPGCRNLLGVLCGRGHLLALARGQGIYEADLERAVAELRYAAGMDDKGRQGEGTDNQAVLDLLVTNAMARSLAPQEKVSRPEIERGAALIRCQFGDEKTWKAALQASGLSIRAIRRQIAADLRTRKWIAGKIARDVDIMPAECRAFYDAHPENFAQPLRLRASHLFLAAPMETPPPIIETKRELIESLSVRLARGEKFSDLVAAASEDEATKDRGGDLGYFSAFRMLPDFFGAVTKLHVGQISPPIRTRLGFHIVQLTDSKPAQQLPFDQARAEISATLESEKRQGSIRTLIVDLCARAECFRATRR